LSPGQNLAWLAGLGLKGGGRALDVGCGGGHAAEMLANDFDEVVAVDLSGPLLDVAKVKRSRPNIRYVLGDAVEYADDAGFDLLYSHTMLHHVTDYGGALEHLKCLVRPGGTVALVDNVCDLYPTPPRKAYTSGAIRDFLGDVRRLGLRDAWFRLRFWFSEPWLAHLLSDRYLSREQFRDLYGSVFPGARFDDLGFALAMTWTAPKTPAVAAPTGRGAR
jgi:ubiquinone/menaquinone biosynthesis C-methylase UbiE